jgi:hypothetical protein
MGEYSYEMVVLLDKNNQKNKVEAKNLYFTNFIIFIFKLAQQVLIVNDHIPHSVRRVCTNWFQNFEVNIEY